MKLPSDAAVIAIGQMGIHSWNMQLQQADHMDIGPRVGHPDPVTVRVFADRWVGKTVELRQTAARQLIRRVAIDDQFRTINGSGQTVEHLSCSRLVAATAVVTASAGGQQE